MVFGCAAVAASIGCDSAALQWDGPVSALADTLGGLVVSRTGVVGFVRPELPPAFPTDSARCEQSVIAARDGLQWYAAWYQRRANASVAVLASRSTDSGRTWSSAGVVDSVDVGTIGCSRPGPSIAANGGYVHVAYSLQAPEGFGVFFAHSMDNAATFHSAISVIYGDRLSATAVAADGMQVAVAYEDPSGTGHRVDVALSRTQGHTFEARQRGSPDEMLAVLPEIAVRSSVAALSFVQPAGGARIVRVGHIH